MTDYREILEADINLTDRQKEVLRAVIAEGTQKKASIALNISHRSVERHIQSAKKKYELLKHTNNIQIPSGYSVKGTSTLYDADGTAKIQWVKTDREKEDLFEDMMDAWNEFAESKIPRVEPTPVPAYCDSDLLCDYTIGDAHVGMYAWAKETGIDWDLLKGTEILRKGMNHLVQMAPPAHTAFILDVGDYFHADNSKNETERSGHKLDVDGRYKKVIDEGLQAIVDMIDLALHKHNKVIYRSVIGNHNDHSAQMINVAIKMRYYNEPRVEVLDSPAIHHYYQFGSNLLADTHGHTHKPDKLPFLMAVDVPEMWSSTKERVWRTGHVHHESVKEYNGVKVITYPTLSPKDAWHTESGYRSNRDMRCSTYHKTEGYIGTNVVNPSKLGYQ